MKKALGVLVALLVATPAMAVVNFTVTDSNGWAEISYDATTGEPNLPRAFALKVTVDSGAEMDVVQFSMGENDANCANCEPFDIYPGNISINGQGVVTGYGSPVAPFEPPDYPPQLPSSTYIIVEMGSLYEKGVGTPPATEGLLVRANVITAASSPVDCNVCISEEATVRGGIVMEDAGPPDGGNNLPICGTIMATPPVSACWNYQSICYGDAQTDGDVDGMDFNKWKNAWFSSNPKYWEDPHGTADKLYNPCADFNRNGKVDGQDFIIWKNTFLNVTPYGTDCDTTKPWPPPGP